MLTVKTRSKIINVESKVIRAVGGREDAVKKHTQFVFVEMKFRIHN